MQSTWKLRPSLPLGDLVHVTGCSPLLLQLMRSRGIEKRFQAAKFLWGDPHETWEPERLPGFYQAAYRIYQAVREKKKIAVYGDYDVDGVCGTTILYKLLKLLGANVITSIPHRSEGYGLHEETLTHLHVCDQVDLVISVDCGISAIQQAAHAKGIGLELIITDHHTIGPVLPDAMIVHPRLPGADCDPNMCGAVVAWHVANAIVKLVGYSLGRGYVNWKDDAYGLIGLATVADVVPLTGDNRAIVANSLSYLLAHPSVGMAALRVVSDLGPVWKINAGHLGFQLGPRINAAGRMGHAQEAVRLLTTDDPMEAKQLAEQLDVWNTERKDYERSVVDDVCRVFDACGEQDGCIVAGSSYYRQGVIGIAAGRIAERYQRPTIIYSIDEHDVCHASGRSVGDFNLHGAIEACSDGLLSWGGHHAACGLSVRVGDPMDQFIDRFAVYCAEHLTLEQKSKKLLIDAETHFSELTLELLDELALLEPHGNSNPRPLLMVDNVYLYEKPKRIGSNKNHLRLKLYKHPKNGYGPLVLCAVGWGMAERISEWEFDQPYQIAFHPMVNEWNGCREVQLELKDFRRPT